MANKSQRNLSELFTGLFVVAVVGLLAFFTIVISGVDLLHRKDSVGYQVLFEHIGSLKEQDPVVVRGMRVGSVQQLTLLEDAVLVSIRIDAKVKLREDYTVTVVPTSMLGGNCLEIIEGNAATPLADVQVLKGTPPKDVMRDLGTLVANLNTAIQPEDVRATLTHLRQATADIATITQRLQAGEGTLGKLLMEDAPYEEMKAMLANLNSVSDGLAKGEGLLGKLLRKDDTTYEDLQATIANLRTVSQNLSEGKGLLGKLMQEDNQAYADLQAALANIRSVTAKLDNPKSGLGRLLSEETTLVTDLETTAANLKTVTAKLERGEGTIGHLMKDDALAKELEGALKDVRQIIDNMRDTAPITTFTSLFFGGL